MPRSLIACYDNIVQFLDAIGDAYGRPGASQRQAHEVMARLANARQRKILRPACMNSSPRSSKTMTAWGKQSMTNIFCIESFARVISNWRVSRTHKERHCWQRGGSQPNI
jgi:hypothetical protein